MKAKKCLFVHNSNVIKCHHNERKYIVIYYMHEVLYCTKEDMKVFQHVFENFQK